MTARHRVTSELTQGFPERLAGAPGNTWEAVCKLPDVDAALPDMVTSAHTHERDLPCHRRAHHRPGQPERPAVQPAAKGVDAGRAAML